MKYVINLILILSIVFCVKLVKEKGSLRRNRNENYGENQIFKNLEEPL